MPPRDIQIFQHHVVAAKSPDRVDPRHDREIRTALKVDEIILGPHGQLLRPDWRQRWPIIAVAQAVAELLRRPSHFPPRRQYLLTRLTIVMTPREIIQVMTVETWVRHRSASDGVRPP